MTLTPHMAPSWVQIDLDTTPPVLALDAPARVSPPDPWVVLVHANEDLGPVVAVFTDALGIEARLGVERVTERLFTIVLPTVGISTGPGELKVVARDRACNAATVRTTVAIERARAFDVTLTMDTGLEPAMSIDHGFEAALEFDHSHEAVASMDHAYEVEGVMSSGLDTSLEITRGPQ